MRRKFAARNSGTTREDSFPGRSPLLTPASSTHRTPPRSPVPLLSRQEEIEKLKGKLTGVAEEGEKITLRIVQLDDLWSPIHPCYPASCPGASARLPYFGDRGAAAGRAAAALPAPLE
jgi:hypothetical protein